MLLGLVGPARAAGDLCLSYYHPPDYPTSTTGPSSSRGPRSRARAVAHLVAIGDLTGSACTASDGTVFHVVFHQVDRDGKVSFGSMELALPLGQSGNSIMRKNLDAYVDWDYPQAAPCPNHPVP